MLDLICIFLPWLLFIYYPITHSLHMLQQNSYNKDQAYLKWVRKNSYKIFASYNICQVAIFILMYYCFTFWDIPQLLIIWALYIIFYFGSAVSKHLARCKEVVKEPLVYTARIKRLIASTIIVYTIVISILYFFINIFYVLIFIAYFQYLLILLILLINSPVEKLVFLKFKRQAMKKLNSIKDLRVVGITGSYGKTSSKNILSEILNIKYNTLPTPKTYNTPNGILITINEHLNKYHEYFIAEMGARNKGEIKELCDLVHPTYGILTIIGTAHLESFGSQKVIQNTKFELIESLPTDGIGILNMDDPLQTNYQLKNKTNLIWISLKNKNADYLADKVETSNQGITFQLKIKGDKKSYPFTTKLLGHANVYNILASIALAHQLKVPVTDLQKAVANVKAVEHRLELKNMGNYYLIDDAYNANISGNKMALEVLASMPGKKIIVTSCMIELGDLSKSANQEYGEEIAKVCDEVFLIGDKQTKDIQAGLKKKKYNSEHIYIFEDITDAFKKLQSLVNKDTYVLLKNDTADIYK